MKRESLTTSIQPLNFQSRIVCWIILMELILTMVWWIIREILLRNGIWERFLTLCNFKAGKSTSKLRFVWEQQILRSRCSGSKKLRFLNQLTNLWHPDRLRGDVIFLTTICLMQWLRLPWRSFSTRTFTSEKSKCRRAACSEVWPILTRNTDFVHDLRAFPCNRSWWSSTRTLNFVRYKFTEWRHPRCRH